MMIIMRIKRFALIAVILLLVDWVLGGAQAQGIIPTWTFLIPNFPVGIIFILMEYSWTGTYYSVFGYRIGDIGSIGVFLAVVLTQAYLYYLLLSWGYEKKSLNHT